MMRYLSVYCIFVKLSFSELTAYRANFYNSALSHILWSLFTFVVMFLLTSKSKQIYGWNRQELFLLTAVFNITSGVFRTIFSKNMARFARIIHLGQLDQYLIKPVDAQFWMSLRYANLGGIIRVLLALGVTVYITAGIGLQLSILQISVFFLLLFLGISILYSVWFFVMTLVMWFSNLMNLEELLNTLMVTVRYPREIFLHAVAPILLVFLPFTLVVTVPTKFLLGKASMNEILLLVFSAVILFILSRLFWKFALRFYTSTS